MTSLPYSHKHLVRPFLKTRPKKFVSYYPEKIRKNKRTVLMRGTIEGTVTSGDPIATTLGNTLRMKLYALFIGYLAGLSPEEIGPAVAGDDCKVFVPQAKVDAYLEAAKSVYATENTA